MIMHKFNCKHNNYCSCLSLSAVDCGILEPPLNGTVMLNSTLLDSVAMYTCDDGFAFEPMRSDSRICESDGEWTGMEPTCIGKYCN